MKNREKYGDKIIKIVLNGETCDFMKNVVIPLYIDGRESSENFCSTNSCEGCSKLFAFWLDGEYNKPPTDWANVPVDTLVQVRDDENDKWELRYFKWFARGRRTPFVTWADGATSKTAELRTEYWKYCELAEEEE
ncbi:MAG: hypothetical protein UEB92_05740 [Clostridia bacterium]|nr:hypothetical protein [Clostridia bacterium]